MITIEEQYQAELRQADIDHHKPTAGAMCGHIIANLWLQGGKLHQAQWFINGPNYLDLQQLYADLIAANRAQLDALGSLLVAEGEVPPATTDEILDYTKLTEDPRTKYHEGRDIVDATARDFVTANLFIDRAVKLADRENRPALAQFLISMRGANNHYLHTLQSVLGRRGLEQLVEVDDDD